MFRVFPARDGGVPEGVDGDILRERALWDLLEVFFLGVRGGQGIVTEVR
jgi:hypothetical protein